MLGYMFILPIKSSQKVNDKPLLLPLSCIYKYIIYIVNDTWLKYIQVMRSMADIKNNIYCYMSKIFFRKVA